MRSVLGSWTRRLCSELYDGALVRYWTRRTSWSIRRRRRRYGSERRPSHQIMLIGRVICSNVTLIAIREASPSRVGCPMVRQDPTNALAVLWCNMDLCDIPIAVHLEKPILLVD